MIKYDRLFDDDKHECDHDAWWMSKICRFALLEPEEMKDRVHWLSLSPSAFNRHMDQKLKPEPSPDISQLYWIRTLDSGEDAHVTLLAPSAHPWRGGGRRLAVLAFRPTTTYQNWATDLMLWQTAAERGSVHTGFQRLYQSLAAALLRLVRIMPSFVNEIICTGMSLGGALAELAAVDLAQKCPDIKFSVQTFGAPRVGNPKWAKWARHVLSGRCHHYVNHADPFPWMLQAPSYVHTGTVVLTRDFSDAQMMDVMAHRRYLDIEFFTGTWQAYLALLKKWLGFAS